MFVLWICLAEICHISQQTKIQVKLIEKTREFNSAEIQILDLEKDVLAKESPGVGVAVVYCPTTHVLDELRASRTLRAFEKNRLDDDAPTSQLDAIVHLTPKTVFESDGYQSWCEEFASWRYEKSRGVLC